MFLELWLEQFAVGDFSSSEVDESEVSPPVKHDIFGLFLKLNTFRSRWVMPLEWRYSSKLTISAT